MSFSDKLSRWKEKKKILMVGSFNKRGCLSARSQGTVMPLLAGHGGVQEEQNNEEISGSGGGSLELQFGVYHMADMICYHDLRLIRQIPMLASIQPVRQRPLDGFTAASLPSIGVSGDGDGGRRWSPNNRGDQGSVRVFPCLV
jgi:hypothetical protein